MTILLVGGGSGGHITPLLAVANELKRQQPKINLVYVGQTGDGLGDIPAKNEHIDAAYTIRAGKLRRYHGEGLKQLLDLQTMFLNLRDTVYVLVGFVQSLLLLRRLQPSVIFIKGGFVGVPVGLAAALLRIPYITHDSDAIPGLANRIIARWAARHAVAAPAERYPYPADKTVTTGIPLRPEFAPVTDAIKRRYRAELELPADAQVLFVIGGGLGSQRVNDAVAEVVPHLLSQHPKLYVIQSAGRANQTAVQGAYEQSLSAAQQTRLTVLGYVNDVYRYSGAADIVVTRAGATNLAEFAVQGKACIVVPSPFLAGGHQLKNADYLASQQAAAIINEVDLAEDPGRLARQVNSLLAEPETIGLYGKRLAKTALPRAAEQLATIILAEAGQ